MRGGGWPCSTSVCGSQPAARQPENPRAARAIGWQQVKGKAVRAPRAEIATALHVLAALRHTEPLSDHGNALIDYIPVLITEVEDLDLPLPTGEFTPLRDTFGPGGSTTEPPRTRRLPERRQHCAAQHREDGEWIAPTIRIALEACDRALTC